MRSQPYPGPQYDLTTSAAQSSAMMQISRAIEQASLKVSVRTKAWLSDHMICMSFGHRTINARAPNPQLLGNVAWPDARSAERPNFTNVH